MADGKFREQAKTLKAAKSLVKKTHKAVIIRPTGFGKTWLLTELIKDYKKVLYLYPSAVIRDTVVNRYYDSMFDENLCAYIDENDEVIDPETVDTFIQMNKIEKCCLMTYAKLVRLDKEDFDKMDYDLVIFDECHRMGAELARIASEMLFAKLGSTADFIGATATPTRTDTFDVVSHFFADNMVYTYTLHDAIQDGIVQKPNYCYMVYDFETDLKDAALTAGEDPENPVIKDIINAKMIEIAKLFNMPSIIKEVCDKYAVNTSYMKFIIFFANKMHMNQKLNDVVSWFQEAYPMHSISTLKITSCSKEETQNVSKLETLTPKPDHIDLIACIDMLNMGYHVNDQTGILMYRGTSSNTIFTQQLGRALSVGANNSAIVFDIVDNLHRKAIFEIRTHASKPRGARPAHTPTSYFISDEDRSTLMLSDCKGNIIESQYHLDGENNVVDKNGLPSTLVYDMDNGMIYNTRSCDNPAKNINNITAECLTAVGREATYKEIIAKAMAEPLTQRCRYALELHFRSWCYQHNIKYPITNEELKRMYGLSKNNFYKEFIQLIKTNNINYPLQDAQALLAIGENGDESVPLKICAKARNVSVNQILECLGIA